ncbi:MAG: O-antigen ligase family protein [Candidatus Omnitrophota bacterium]
MSSSFFDRRGQLNPAPIILLLFLFLFSVVIAVNIQRFPPLMVLGAVAGLAVGVLTLVNTNLGLIVLIFSMLWSPEIPIAATPERAVVLRVDDFLIIAVFFTWLAKMAITRQTGFLRHTPLNLPIFLYLGANIFSTGLGIMSGDVDAKVSFFYILKFCEFFMIYFIFANNIQNEKQLKTFIFFFLLTSFTIGLFTYAQLGRVDRPTAPFEGEHPEPNTLGGYLLLCLAIIAGLFLQYKFSVTKVVLAFLSIFNLYPLAMTLSRSSYGGLSVAYMALLFITKRGKLLLAMLLTLFILFFPVIVPKPALKRILNTFSGQQKFETAGIKVKLEDSAAVRVYNYQFALLHIKNRPFFGYGVTGLGLIDAQYARSLVELGIVGFLSLLYLIWSVLKNTFQVFREVVDDFGKGLSLGFLCGFIGLLVVGIGANVFVIVRISEPLWFLAACVMSLPEASS